MPPRPGDREPSAAITLLVPVYHRLRAEFEAEAQRRGVDVRTLAAQALDCWMADVRARRRAEGEP